MKMLQLSWFHTFVHVHQDSSGSFKSTLLLRKTGLYTSCNCSHFALILLVINGLWGPSNKEHMPDHNTMKWYFGPSTLCIVCYAHTQMTLQPILNTLTVYGSCNINLVSLLSSRVYGHKSMVHDASEIPLRLSACANSGNPAFSPGNETSMVNMYDCIYLQYAFAYPSQFYCLLECCAAGFQWTSYSGL